MASFNVDWDKTNKNIKFLLKGKTYAGNFSDAFSLEVRSVQHKLSSKSKEHLSVEELAIIARYLGCDILDLVVFETDTFFDPDSNVMKERIPVDDPTPEDVSSSLLGSDEKYNEFPIRNIYEFLLYLPLIDETRLRDVVFRCQGNYSPLQRGYILHQFRYLYCCIPESPEKLYADYYRDSMLRIKGDRPCQFNSVEGETAYWLKAHSYGYDNKNTCDFR